MAEAELQQIVDPIVDGKTDTVAPERKAASDRIWALWHRRSRYRELESQEVQLNGNVGNDLTKEQEENLEKNGYMFARKSGIMPARQLNGLELHMNLLSGCSEAPRRFAFVYGPCTGRKSPLARVCRPGHRQRERD
ncbi:MAG: hypothetical protein WA858_25650 [Xanthobacteraceae bacterium]